MKRLIILLAIIPMIMGTGCMTHLKVQVDVFDREKLLQDPMVMLEDSTSLLSKAKKLASSSDLNVWENKVHDQIEEVFLKEEAVGIIGDGEAQEFISEVQNTFSKDLLSIQKDLDTFLITYDEAIELRGEKIEKSKFLTAQKLAQRAFSALHSLRNRMEYDLEKIIQGILEDSSLDDTTKNKITNNIEAGRKELDHTFDQFFGKYSIMGDPLSSLVVGKYRGKKEKYWKKKYNKTVSRSWFGNSDIAFTMRSLGDFTIKGVRQDATQVIEASFKAISTGIKALATAYGVPTSGGGTGNENDTFSQLAELENDNQELEERQTLAKNAQIQLLRAIVTQTDSLGSDNARSNSVKHLQDVFDTYKVDMYNSGTSDSGISDATK